MKNLFKVFIFSIIAVMNQSCETNDEILLDEGLALKSKESVAKLSLDIKYNINKEDYSEFLESLTFDEKGNFRGAIFTEVEKYLSDEQSEEFWSNFGITIRKIEQFNNQKSDGPNIYSGYKPKPRGCKKNNRWICSISGDIQQ